MAIPRGYISVGRLYDRDALWLFHFNRSRRKTSIPTFRNGSAVRTRVLFSTGCGFIQSNFLTAAYLNNYLCYRRISLHYTSTSRRMLSEMEEEKICFSIQYFTNSLTEAENQSNQGLAICPYF